MLEKVLAEHRKIFRKSQPEEARSKTVQQSPKKLETESHRVVSGFASSLNAEPSRVIEILGVREETEGIEYPELEPKVQVSKENRSVLEEVEGYERVNARRYSQLAREEW